MVRLVMGMYRYLLETTRNFNSRCSQEAARVVERTGGNWWARNWVMASSEWLSHLKREFEKQMQVWSGALTVDQACYF